MSAPRSIPATWVTAPRAANSREPEMHLRIVRNSDGRYVCTGLFIEAPEITARALRAIHLPDLIEAALALSSEQGAPLGNPRIRRRRLDDAHFETVAAGYRTAMDRAPSRPTSWLADEWQVPEPTLRRWIQRARDKGLLGRSAPGRAGEYPASIA